jgi:hypothetical protein
MKGGRGNTIVLGFPPEATPILGKGQRAMEDRDEEGEPRE